MHYESCVLIDGAIASGITVIALMAKLSKTISHFEILSVHGTIEGIRAILRCADQLNVNISVKVGHLSGVLNSEYYAVSADGQSTLQVGDLGDTIANLQ